MWVFLSDALLRQEDYMAICAAEEGIELLPSDTMGASARHMYLDAPYVYRGVQVLSVKIILK